MRKAMIVTAILAALVLPLPARAATIQFLSPFGLNFGVAHGVDGLKVVGESNIGWLYDGTAYQVIQVPWGGVTIPHDVSGNNIVGVSGNSSFLFDGASYTKLTHPLGTNGTNANSVDGSNIVGYYTDSSSLTHGFLYNGTSYTTLDVPGAKNTFAYGIDATNVVGYYTDSKNRTHGFVYNGTSYTTLDDPLFPAAGTTAIQGIDGGKIVGNTQTGSVAGAGFLYDAASFTHPFGIEPLLGGNNHFFNGISGNRIVGTYQDKPFVYVIPEPSTVLLAILGTLGLFVFARNKRSRASPRLG